MIEKMKEQLKQSLTEMFENVDADLWVTLTIVMLPTVKEVCVEYYNKGRIHQYNKFKEMLKALSEVLPDEYRGD